MSEELTNIEVIIFEDEDGFEMEMEIIDEFDYENVHYAALSEVVEDLESIPDDSDEDTINFFAVIEENDEESFDLVEDKELLDKLFDILENRLLSKQAD